MFPQERGGQLEGNICKHTPHPEVDTPKKSIKKIFKDERIFKQLITIIIVKIYIVLKL